MHHDDSDLAVIVISQQFELIDNVGNIVADFASSNAFAAFPGLIFHNLNAAGIADGVLYWSTDAAGPATTELVALVGPRPVGASATSARVVLRGDTSGQSTAQLTAPAATGLSNGQVFVQRTGPTLSVASMNARDDTSISAAIQLVAQTGVVTAFVIADTVALQPTTAISLNGRTAQMLVGEGTGQGSFVIQAVTAAFVDVAGCTVSIPNCVVGDVIYVAWQAYVETVALATDLCQVSLVANGVFQPESASLKSGGVAAGATVSMSKRFAAIAGTNTFKLQTAAGVAGNFQLIGAPSGGRGCNITVQVFGTK